MRFGFLSRAERLAEQERKRLARRDSLFRRALYRYSRLYRLEQAIRSRLKW